MGKKVVAVTQVRHGETDGKAHVFEAGEELDPGVFTEQQLRDLYAAGAVRVEDSEAVKKADQAADKLASGEQNAGEADQPINDEAPQQEDPKPASAAVSAKTAGPTQTPTKGTSPAKK